MPEDIKCPIRGSETVLRTATQGPKAGLKFYVCTRYPECKGKVAIREEKDPDGFLVGQEENNKEHAEPSAPSVKEVTRERFEPEPDKSEKKGGRWIKIFGIVLLVIGGFMAVGHIIELGEPNSDKYVLVGMIIGNLIPGALLTWWGVRRSRSRK